MLLAQAAAVVSAWKVRRTLEAGAPLPLRGLSGSSGAVASDRLVRAAHVSAARATFRLVPLNTCLTRSVVLFRLLEGFRDVELHCGFRRVEGRLDGHAWVSANGAPIGETEASLEGFVESEDRPLASAPDLTWR